LIARPSPNLSLDDDPPSPRPSARRHWRCTSIAAGPIGKLEAEGVIQRQGDGFALDPSRVAYLRYLRRERRQSPRSEADADFQRAKSELIRLRIAEKQRHLIPLEEAVGHMDEVVGLFISRLSGFAARCGGRDLAARRVIDQAVYDLRLEISEAATKLADQRGEPPLDDAT
jgi:hypothetical protein